MGEVEDEDRWLEEVESEQALKWVREKNEGTLAGLSHCLLVCLSPPFLPRF